MRVAGTSGSSVVGLTSAGRVKVVGTRGKDAEADTDTSRVAVASGISVVSSLGTTVSVVGASAGSCGGIVSVAGTSGSKVVGSASAGRVKVVGKRGKDSTGSEADAETEISTVIVASGSSVVSSDGTMVTVAGTSFGPCGSIVIVAGRSDGKVVGSRVDGNVRVVRTRGTDVGRSLPTAGTVRVTGASGSKVVASLGTIVTVDALSPGVIGWSVKVAETSGMSVVGSTGWSVSVVNGNGMVVGRSTEGTVRVAGVSGNRVVASLGTIVTTDVASPGIAGCKVRVAETSGSNVVGSTG